MNKKTIVLSLIFLIITGGFTTSFADFGPIWHCTGATDTSHFGRFLVAAGDQNLDGFDDILVTNYGSGEVYLYFGGNPMDTIPDMVFTEPHDRDFGYLPLECKDLNGDGYPDFCISADCGPVSSTFNQRTYIYFGGPLLDNHYDLIITPDSLANFLAEFGQYTSMGDFNGDGWNDLAVGAMGYRYSDLGFGKIYVFYGGPSIDSIPDYSVTGRANDISVFGEQLSISGDVNNDNFDDIITRGERVEPDNGRMLFLGGIVPDTIPAWEIREYSTSTFNLGYGCFILPDFSGDGCDEIVIGGLENIWCSAFIFFGGQQIDTTWDLCLSGFGSNQRGCAYAGDINADGLPDVLLGNWEMGEVSVFFMYPGHTGTQIRSFYVSYSYIGWNNMGYAGDINGDGIDDFMFATYGDWYEDHRGEVFIWSDTTLTPDVEERHGFIQPEFRLCGNYPNPFNSSTTIVFNCATKEYIDLSVYNILGHKVASLINGRMNPGYHYKIWNGCDDKGNSLSTGVYITRLSSYNFNQKKRLLLIR